MKIIKYVFPFMLMRSVRSGMLGYVQQENKQFRRISGIFAGGI
ncbi:hypothetical protein HS7_14080 [Sulfolobales archaeon HS-7]|nr:hypothetical protein HS7_14080 [Sulfolobales archaeon HS-7]